MITHKSPVIASCQAIQNSMQVSGYDKQLEIFCLRINLNAEETIMSRDYHDFIRLNRTSRKYIDDNSLDGIPSKSFKKLMLCSWTYNDSDWNKNLSKSVRKVDEWLSKLTSQLTNQGIPIEEFDWFYNDLTYNIFKTQISKRREFEAHSRMCQQYFSSTKNIQSIFDYSTNTNTEELNTLFIEPSCGDGRVMKHFIANGFTIIGCDIDKTIINKVRFDNNDENNLIITSDFRLTTREDYVTRFHQQRNMQPQKIVVVGCPPYTQTIKTSSIPVPVDQNIDLLEVFFLHCAHTLMADKIIFVVSDRCGSSNYINNLSNLLNRQPTNPTLYNQKSWTLVQMTDADNTFEISGRNISQPSIIQVWECI